MSYKKSHLNKYILLAGLILIAIFFVCIKYQTIYRAEFVTNIQYGQAYSDTTSGFSFVFPQNYPWEILRYDEIEVRISDRQGWEKSFGIMPQKVFNAKKYTSPYPIAKYIKLENEFPTHIFESHNFPSAELGD